MGTFINKRNEGFRQIRNSEYVDKSGLIAVVNKTLFTQQKLSNTLASLSDGRNNVYSYYQIRNRI